MEDFTKNGQRLWNLITCDARTSSMFEYVRALSPVEFIVTVGGFYKPALQGFITWIR
jgi:hypothetical protein